MNLEKSKNKAVFIKRFFISYLRHHINKNLFRISINPFLAIINLTTRCNFNCKFCQKIFPEKDLSFSSYNKIIKECYKLRIPYISFSGGEPLLNKKVFNFAKIAKKKGFYLNLGTNGYLIQNKRIAYKVANNFDSIRISLHNLREGFDQITRRKGSYNKVIESLNQLIQYRNQTQIGINIVISDSNLNVINKLILKYKNKVDFISLLPEVPFKQEKSQNFSGKSKKISRAFKRLYKESKTLHSKNFIKDLDLNYSRSICEAGRLHISFMSDGSIYSCPYVGKGSKKFFVGRVTKELDLRRILNQKSHINYSKYCGGCYSTCTTEITNMLNNNPINLLTNNLNKIKNFLRK